MPRYRVAAVDIAAARSSTLVLLDGLRVVEWFAAGSVGEAIEWLRAYRPDVVAVDARCSLSHGLLADGLDGAKPYAGRVCDLELMRRAISLYQVPQHRADATSWMEVGYQLYDALRDAGYSLPRSTSVPGSVIEIYPHAGVAAFIGLRYLQGRAMAVGDPREALLWLPVTELMASYYVPPAARRTTSMPESTASPTLRPPCACGCGGIPKGRHSRFLPGHDAKLRGRSRR